MANKPLKSITFPGLTDKYTVPQIDNTLAVSGAAADAKKTGDEITNLKADFSQTNERLGKYIADTSIWEDGAYTYNTGNAVVDNAWMRTKYFIPNEYDDAKTLSSAYKLALYAWNNELSYVGNYNGSAFVKTSTSWFGAFDLAALRNAYPEYLFKICVSTADGSNITDAAKSSIGFYNSKFSVLVAENSIYRVSSYPDIWMRGGISYNNGNLSTYSAWLMTSDYLPETVLYAKVAKESRRMAIYAWENDVYIGCYNGTAFIKTATSYRTYIDIAKLRFDYPTYKFKLILENVNIASDIPLSEADNVVFTFMRASLTDELFSNSPNLYDYFTSFYATADLSTGAITYNMTTGTNKISAKIPVDGGATYTCNQLWSAVMWYAENDLYLGYESVEEEPHTFQAPSNAVYCRVYLNGRRATNLQLNKGDSLNDYYTPYFRCKIKEENILKTDKPYRVSSIPIPQQFGSETIYPIDGTVSGYDDNNLTPSIIYGWYDALMEAYPDYITRKDWGMDQSNTYHIYSYSFKPEPLEEDYYLSDMKPLPKIMIRGGCHGNGAYGDHTNMIYCLYYMLYDVCHNSEVTPFISYLRHNVVMEVLPCMNPWGIANKTRANSRGVDVLGNFPYGWTQMQSSAPDYGGSAPFTEKEALAIRDFILANNDALFDIEFHSVSREFQTQSHMMYFEGIFDSEMLYVARSVITELTLKWNADANHPNLSHSGYHGYIDGIGGNGHILGWVDKQLGIPSVIMEGFANYEDSGVGTNSMEILKMNLDEVESLVLNSIRYFFR